MVKIYYRDWKQNWGENHDGAEKTLEFLSKNKNFNKNVIFPWTCNYATYIFKISKDLIRVETCNNHDWWKEGLQKKFAIKVMNDDWDNLTSKEKFLDLTNMKTKTGDEFCQEEWDELNEKIKEKGKKDAT